MSPAISREAVLFLQSVWLGCRMMLLYDFLRLIRFLLPHGRLVRDLEDFFYWMICGEWAFLTAYRENDGVIRWFFLAGILLGQWIWYFLFSKTLQKVLRWVRMKRTNKILTEKKKKEIQIASVSQKEKKE